VVGGGCVAGGCVAGGCVAGTDVAAGVAGVGVTAGRATEDWSVRGLAKLCSLATRSSVWGATVSSTSGHRTCGGGFTWVDSGTVTSSRMSLGESASGLRVKK
jgi:hypothetical protein